MAKNTKDKDLTPLILLSVFTVPFSWAFNIHGVRVTITELLFFIALLVWLFNTIRYNVKIELGQWGVPMALFMVACVLSIPGAQNKFLAVKGTIHFVWLFGLYYLIFNFTNNKSKLRNIALSLIAGGIIASFIGLYQHFFINEPFDFRISGNRLRAYALFGQPNAFGNYLIGLILLTIGFYININRRWRIPCLLVLFAMSMSLFSTFSRGSWIGLIFGAVTMVFAVIIYNKSLVASLLLPFAVILLSGGIILGDVYMISPHETLRHHFSDEKIMRHHFSDEQRFLLLKSGGDMVKKHPLTGVGVGNFPAVLPQYATPELKESLQIDYDGKTGKFFVNPRKPVEIEIVHNMLLQVAAEIGLLGLIAFLWLFYALFSSSYRALSKVKGNTADFAIRAGLIGSFTAVVVSGLFGWPFSHGVQEILILSMALSNAPWKYDEDCTGLLSR